MKDHKIVAIVGATGAQGGGLARAILADPASAFSVRAITRRPESAPARALAARGADIVAADLDRAETLKRAFDGAHAVFCVTNFWEHGSPERELAQAAAMAHAVACAGNEHVIWSTLEDTRQWVPLDERPDADAARPLQGPPLRRQGRSQRGVHAAPRTGHVSPDVVLLGQLHRLPRHGAAPGRRRRDHADDADGRQAAAGHRRRGHRPVRLRRPAGRARSTSAGLSGSQASISPGSSSPPRCRGRSENASGTPT